MQCIVALQDKLFFSFAKQLQNWIYVLLVGEERIKINCMH